MFKDKYLYAPITNTRICSKIYVFIIYSMLHLIRKIKRHFLKKMLSWKNKILNVQTFYIGSYLIMKLYIKKYIRLSVYLKKFKIKYNSWN